MPFEGLLPAAGVEHARWVVESMRRREGVALVVPAGFQAYARLLHPLPGGRRWATVAPEYLEGGAGRYRYPFPEELAAVEGDMAPELVDALVPVLDAATATARQCHFGLWMGWADLHPFSRPSLYAVGDGRWTKSSSTLTSRRCLSSTPTTGETPAGARVPVGIGHHPGQRTRLSSRSSLGLLRRYHSPRASGWCTAW